MTASLFELAGRRLRMPVRALGGALVAAVLTGPAPARSAGPPVPTDPFVVSTDTARYGKRVSQQIPAIARVGPRWFCIWYGVNKGEPGISGEGTGCYNILALSDDGCRTWREAAYFVPNPTVAAQSVIDPRLAATPEGPLLILIPVSGQKGRTRSVWTIVLENPLSRNVPFAFGPPACVDFGFVGSPALIGGKVHFTANQNTAGPPPWPEGAGMKLYRVSGIADGRIRADRVSLLPFAAADGSLNSCFEVSLAETGPGQILACFRTTGPQYLTRSRDGGATWDTPAPFTEHPNAANAKADLARSPSGRLVLAFNRMAASRDHMCVALSSDGGRTWPQHYVFDDRKGPGTSYPNVAFGADAQGNYDGNIHVAYDHGRGRRPPEFTKEILVAVISEESVAAGHPTRTLYVVSK